MARRYVQNVLAGLIWLGWGLSHAVNAARGGDPGEALCHALGRSMQDGGWASLVRWPAWFRRHCIRPEPEPPTFI